MSKTQLAYNMKIEGGFLIMLAGLIAFLTGTVLPSLGAGKLEKIAMIALSALNTISSLISKALLDDFILDEEYSLI